MGGVARQILKPKVKQAAEYAPTKAEVSQATSTSMVGSMTRGKGRSSTILTGAKGLGDNALTTSKRTLLGG